MEQAPARRRGTSRSPADVTTARQCAQKLRAASAAIRKFQDERKQRSAVGSEVAISTETSLDRHRRLYLAREERRKRRQEFEASTSLSEPSDLSSEVSVSLESSILSVDDDDWCGETTMVTI